jgi:hypothetical protein
MRRREFIGCLAGIAGWPVVARGKQPEIPVIGYLDSLGPQTGASELNIFRKALSKAGYVEGRNVSIEFRWAEGQRDRLPVLAARVGMQGSTNPWVRMRRVAMVKVRSRVDPRPRRNAETRLAVDAAV